MKEWLLCLIIIIFEFVQGYYMSIISVNLIEICQIFVFIFFINLLIYNVNLYIILDKFRVTECFVFNGKCVCLGHRYFLIFGFVCYIYFAYCHFFIIYCHHIIEIQTFNLFLIVVWTGSNGPMNET